MNASVHASAPAQGALFGALAAPLAIEPHRIEGSAKDDSLVGTAGDDLIRGNGGSDTLEGAGGNDRIEGGSVRDLIYGGDGQDTLIGNEGDDVLQGDAGDDSLVGGDGDDGLTGGDGQDTIVAGAGDDYLDGGAGDDSLESGAGNDIVSAREGNDTLRGGDGNDVLMGQAGNDLIDGGDGDDFLWGGDGNDLLLGGAGVDVLLGENGNDTLDGGAGNDLYEASRGQTVILFGRDSDQDSTSTNSDRKFVVRLKDGIRSEEVRLRNTGRDNGRELQLSITGSDAVLHLPAFFSDGYFAGSYQVEAIEFANGTRWTLADIRREVLRYTDGNDTIYADGSESLIRGGAGNDWLQGTEYRDTLDGGAGDDTLVGNYGAHHGDLLLFGQGGGHDVIRTLGNPIGRKPDEDGDASIVQLGAGIAPADVQVSFNGPHLVLTIASTGDTLTIEDYHGNRGLIEAGAGLRPIRFADGTSWGYDDINRKFHGGSAGDDAIRDTRSSELLQGQGGNDKLSSVRGGNDTLDGGAGNDALYERVGASKLLGGAGDDTLNAGNTGNDTLDGGAGNDSLSANSNGWNLLLGGDGQDTLNGSDNKDTLDGGTGDDRLYGRGGDDLLRGGDGHDLLDGGSGNDTLNGGAGYNTYVFRKGSGKDVIDTSGGQQETLRLDAGISANEVKLQRIGDSLLLTLKGNSSDTLTVKNFFIGEATAGHEVDWIQFADGTQWGLNTIKAKVLAGSANADTLTGYASDDRISGLAGNDLIHGRSGKDLLEGGDGNDQLFGDAGVDSLYGGTGDDTLDGGDGDDLLLGGAGNDVLNGGVGQDTLDGGSGDDTLIGVFAGLPEGDTVLFGHGSGHDVLTLPPDQEYNAPSPYDPYSPTANVVQLKPGITPDDVAVSLSSSYDLVISLNGGADTLTLESYYAFAAMSGEIGSGFARIRFADGTEWGYDQIGPLLSPQGTSGNDTLAGRPGNDLIHGGDGDDEIYASLGGRDTVYGDAGNDTLDGSYFNYSDLEFHGGAGNDSIIGGNHGNQSNLITGDDGDDTLIGNALNNTVSGGAGNDEIQGLGFLDILDGGDGDDTIFIDAGLNGDQVGESTVYGGAGADIFVFGHAHAFISSVGAGPGPDGQVDILRIPVNTDPDGDGISDFADPDKLTLQREAGTNELQIGFVDKADIQLRIADYFAGNAQGVQYVQIEFSGSTVTWDLEEVLQRLGGDGAAPIAAVPSSLSRQAEGLVSAMAAFAAPASPTEGLHTGIVPDRLLVADGR